MSCYIFVDAIRAWRQLFLDQQFTVFKARRTPPLSNKGDALYHTTNSNCTLGKLENIS